jgi:hypothetical protein
MPALMIPNMPNMHQSMAQGHHLTGYHTPTLPMQSIQLAQSQMMMNNGGSNGAKRKIHLRLLEDIPVSSKRVSFLGFGGRKKSKRASLLTPRNSDPPEEEEEQDEFLDRGRVTVSWYDGTTSLELLQHVQNSVMRKLGLDHTSKLSDLRILDEGFDPPEEIVLSPYIPDGSRLLLRFSIRDKGGYSTPPIRPYDDGPPISPSAAPSPNRINLNGLGLNPDQLAMLGTRLNGESSRTPRTERKKPREKRAKASKIESKGSNDDENESDDLVSHASTTLEMNSLHPEDQIEKSLRQITELLLADRTTRYVPQKREKRQVIFTLANYFVLFL